MKKLLLVSAVAALSVTSAYAETGVYGKIGADLKYADDGDVTLDNNGSRLGVKGSTPITANTNAIYQAELGLSIDGDSGADISVRDTYLGLQNNAVGTLKAGKLTAVDDAVKFGNPSDYWNSGFQGFGEVEIDGDTVEVNSFDGGRKKNMLAYASPNFSGFQALAMYQVDSASNGGENKSKAKDGGNIYGVAGKYESDALSAGASYVKVKDFADSVRLGGKFSVTPQVALSAGYQMTDYDRDGSEKENAYMVAGEYDIPNSPWATYVEYDGAKNILGIDGADKNTLSLGGTYAFNKAVSGRVYAGFEDWDGGDTYGVGTGLTYKF